MGDAGIANYKDVKFVFVIGIVDDFEDGFYVFKGLVEITGYGEAHDGSLAVCGNGLLSLGELLGGQEGEEDIGDEVVLGRGGDNLGAEVCELGGEGDDPVAELGVIHGQGVGLDDDYFVDGFRIAEPLFEQLVSAGGLGAAAEGELRGGGGLEDVHKAEIETESRVVGQAAADDGENEPNRNYQMWPTGAYACQVFGHRVYSGCSMKKSMRA